MKTLKLINKIVAVGIIGVLGLGVLSGCTMGPTQKEIQEQIDAAVLSAEAAAIASVDITADNEAAIAAATQIGNAENARLQAVLEDAKAAQAEIAAELAVAQSTGVVDENGEVVDIEEVSLGGYLIDDVRLDGNFSATIDNDDLAKLYYVDIDDYEDEDYVVEEKLYVTSDVAPVLNMEDLNGEVVVELGAKGAVTYMIEFDTGIDFVAASDDALEVDFLGEEMKIVDYDGTEVTFRLSQSHYIKQDESVTVEGKVITLKGVNDDGDKVYVDVDGVSKSIGDGEKETINGIEILANDIFGGNNLAIAQLFIGKDVEETIADGDEYAPNDDYEWVITESGNKLTGIGIRYDVKLVDDNEVLKVEDSLVLPNEYLTLSFLGAKDMEGLDLSLNLNNVDIDLDFDGKIEIDGDKVDDSSLTLYINAQGDAAFDYRYKSDKYENNTDFTDVAIINDDRELNLKMNGTQVNVYDADVDYTLDYVFGGDFASVAGTETADVNDDDDYRVSNGDLLYSSELNDDGEDSFIVSIKNDEEVELLMRVD